MSHLVVPVGSRVGNAEAVDAEDLAGLSRELAQALREVSASLAEATRHQKETIEATQRLLAHQVGLQARNDNDASESERRRLSRPTNEKWWLWRGLCLDMQEKEQALRRISKGVPSKVAFAMHYPETVRQINYAMRGYGLSLDQWPPSTWDPDEDRDYHSPKT